MRVELHSINDQNALGERVSEYLRELADTTALVV